MKPLRIAVIKGASIGDAMLSFPLLRNIRRNFPDAQIYFITGDATSGIELLKTCPYINKIIQFKRGKTEAAKNIFKLVYARTLSFDIIFDGAPNTEKSQRLARLIHARKTIIINNYSTNRPIVEMDLSMLKELGYETDDGHLETFFNIKRQKREKNHMLVYSGRDSDFHRTWETENWGKLLRNIKKKHSKMRFSIIGGADCKKRAQNIIEHIEIEDLTDKLSLEDMANMLSKCRMLITTNGGPMQLARALETPMVAIHGPSPDMWLPTEKNTINLKAANLNIETKDPNVLYADKRFSPNNIPVRSVLAAIERMLKIAK